MRFHFPLLRLGDRAEVQFYNILRPGKKWHHCCLDWSIQDFPSGKRISTGWMNKLHWLKLLKNKNGTNNFANHLIVLEVSGMFAVFPFHTLKFLSESSEWHFLQMLKAWCHPFHNVEIIPKCVFGELQGTLKRNTRCFLWNAVYTASTFTKKNQLNANAHRLTKNKGKTVFLEGICRRTVIYVAEMMGPKEWISMVLWITRARDWGKDGFGSRKKKTD